jgi:hypothetical protein
MDKFSCFFFRQFEENNKKAISSLGISPKLVIAFENEEEEIADAKKAGNMKNKQDISTDNEVYFLGSPAPIRAISLPTLLTGGNPPSVGCEMRYHSSAKKTLI